MLTEKNIHLNKSPMRRYIERILCPTDLSTDSDEALRYAVALAKDFNAKLFIFHSIEDSKYILTGQYNIENLFTESVGPYISQNDVPKLDWEGVVEEGSAIETIARVAAKHRADLIVMRSRRRPLGTAFLGSTAELLCRNAPCPVLVTHPDEREWVNNIASKINLKRLLLAYDFSDYSELALSYALSLAEEYQAELHLLHVLPSNLENGWYPNTENSFNKVSHRLHYSVPEEVHLWCTVKHAIRVGSPYREIIDYSEENNIDLICMGAHGTGFNKFAIFGSNVERVLRQAQCPIFIARPLKPAITIPTKRLQATTAKKELIV